MKNESLIKQTEQEFSNLPTISKIKNEEGYLREKENFKKVKEAYKTIEDRRDLILDPLKKSMKETKELFSPFLDILDETITLFTENLNEYANRIESERISEMERINADKRLKNPDTIQRLRDEVTEKPPGTMTIKYPVIFDEGLIPDKFWVIDTVLLRKELLKGIVIPGAKLGERLVVTAK